MHADCSNLQEFPSKPNICAIVQKNCPEKNDAPTENPKGQKRRDARPETEQAKELDPVELSA